MSRPNLRWPATPTPIAASERARLAAHLWARVLDMYRSKFLLPFDSLVGVQTRSAEVIERAEVEAREELYDFVLDRLSQAERLYARSEPVDVSGGGNDCCAPVPAGLLDDIERSGVDFLFRLNAAWRLLVGSGTRQASSQWETMLEDASQASIERGLQAVGSDRYERALGSIAQFTARPMSGGRADELRRQLGRLKTEQQVAEVDASTSRAVWTAFPSNCSVDQVNAAAWRGVLLSWWEGLDDSDRYLSVNLFCRHRRARRVAAELGISDVQIFRRKKRILERLRRAVSEAQLSFADVCDLGSHGVEMLEEVLKSNPTSSASAASGSNASRESSSSLSLLQDEASGRSIRGKT